MFHPFAITPAETRRLRQLYREHRFVVLEPPILPPEHFEHLAAEARLHRRIAWWPDRLRTADGTVVKNSARGWLGRWGAGLLSSPSTLALLVSIIGCEVEPSWTSSCYTYYDYPGSLLGRHVDKPDDCFVTILFGVESRWPQLGWVPPGNQLWLYFDRDSPTPSHRITTLANRAVILDGKSLMHGRPALGEKQRVTVFAGCFRLRKPSIDRFVQ